MRLQCDSYESSIGDKLLAVMGIWRRRGADFDLYGNLRLVLAQLEQPLPMTFHAKAPAGTTNAELDDLQA